MPILGVIASSKLTAAAGDYQSIQTVTCSTAQSNISFTAIPSNFTNLQIRGVLKWDYSSNASPDSTAVGVRFNGDTGSSYPYTTLSAPCTGTNATSIGSTAITKGIGGYSGAMNSFSAYSYTYAGFILDIWDYTNTNKYKSAKGLAAFDTNGGLARWSVGGFSWTNTAAITQIDVFPDYPNWAAGSTLTLYGIKGGA
jgi:hypothetical protein